MSGRRIGSGAATRNSHIQALRRKAYISTSSKSTESGLPPAYYSAARAADALDTETLRILVSNLCCLITERETTRDGL